MSFKTKHAVTRVMLGIVLVGFVATAIVAIAIAIGSSTSTPATTEPVQSAAEPVISKEARQYSDCVQNADQDEVAAERCKKFLR